MYKRQGEAFRHIGTSSREPYKGWLLEIYDRLEHKNRGTLEDIWEDTAREYLGASGLPEEELDKLINLGGQLGVADIEMQVKTLDLYLEEMSLSMEETVSYTHLAVYKRQICGSRQ